MKAKVIILAIMMSMALTTLASNVPLIRPDRVWESLSWEPDVTFKYMKFNGTEVFLGNEYSRVSTFRKIVGYGTSMTNVREYLDGIDETEGYLREKEGVVYTLLDGDSQYKGGNVYDSLREGVLYDFNCPDGETYNGITFVLDWVDDGSFNVKGSDSILIAGEECRQMEIAFTQTDSSWEYPESYKIIEGIGATYRGCLQFTNFSDQTTGMVFYHWLNRVFDMDGNLIYSAPDSFDFPCDPFTGVGSVAADSGILTEKDGKITFESGAAGSSVAIIDMTGATRLSACGSGHVELDTSSLAQGVYVAVAYSGGMPVARHKFVISGIR